MLRGSDFLSSQILSILLCRCLAQHVYMHVKYSDEHDFWREIKTNFCYDHYVEDKMIRKLYIYGGLYMINEGH